MSGNDTLLMLTFCLACVTHMGSVLIMRKKQSLAADCVLGWSGLAFYGISVLLLYYLITRG